MASRTSRANLATLGEWQHSNGGGLHTSKEKTDSKVGNIKEDIDYYVNENQAVDFTEDEEIYNDLNLQEEEDLYGVGDNDLQSSLDAQSVTEEHPSTPQKEEIPKPKEPSTTTRRASVAATRPIVTSTTVTIPPLPSANGVPKPASQTTRPPTELKYASAVAAATNPASLLGLGPLPPPATTAPPIRQASVSSIGSSGGNPARASSPVVATTNNTPPTIAPPVPVYPLAKDKNVTTNESPKNVSSPPVPTTIPDTPSQSQPQEPDAETAATSESEVPLPVPTPWTDDLSLVESPTTFTMNGSDEADIAMLPPGLRDLLRSFQTARSRAQSSSVSS